MKHFIGALFFAVAALVVRFALPRSMRMDFHVQSTYFSVMPIRILGFWLLIGVAAVWFLIAAYKSARIAP
jgi:hypothetical protein